MLLLATGDNRGGYVDYSEPREPDEYKIIAKYFPEPLEHENEFLIVVSDHEGAVYNCWVPTAHFGDMEIHDLLYVPGARDRPDKWLTFREDYQVRRVYVPLEETIDILGFVSLPVRIGNEAYYVCRADRHWTVISYSTAKDYFGRAEASVSQVDHYRVLGIPQGASQDQIRCAYRNRAWAYHPDRAPTGREMEFANRMCVLNEAYTILRDPQRRAQYDRRESVPARLKRWPGGGPGTLTALIERRQHWWNVRKILRFRRLTREQGFEVPINQVLFGEEEVHIPVNCGDGLRGMVCVGEHSFPACSVMNDIKGGVPGYVVVTMEEEKRARWHDDLNEPDYQWVTTHVRLTWPSQAVIELMRLTEHVTI